MSDWNWIEETPEQVEEREDLENAMWWNQQDMDNHWIADMLRNLRKKDGYESVQR